jgi:hypothetical protein
MPLPTSFMHPNNDHVILPTMHYSWHASHIKFKLGALYSDLFLNTRAEIGAAFFNFLLTERNTNLTDSDLNMYLKFWSTC